MEPIAVNETVITRKRFYEAMAAADNYRRSALRSMLILAGLWVILLIATFVLDGSVVMAVAELALLALIGLWLVFFLPRTKYRRAFKAMQLRSEGDLNRRTEFFEDCCVTDSNGVGVEVRYREITAIRRTEHMLVLVCEDKTGLMLAASGFTEGSCEQVIRQIETAKEHPEENEEALLPEVPEENNEE